jgi:hypothetical protein
MPGPVPGIHVFAATKTWIAPEVRLARLPHKFVPQVGYIRLAVTNLAMTVGSLKHRTLGVISPP